MRYPFKSLLILAILSIVHAVSGQELILPLTGNPLIEHSPNQYPSVRKALAAPLELPFIDDFSSDEYIPDPGKWSDRDAFINRNYAVDPPSIGVATLDAIDSVGSIYPDATMDPKTFIADQLTSRPINLSYPVSDSIYLSFYYQPMGTGIEPGPQDSLALDLFQPVPGRWTTVWNTGGDTLTPFRQVMIPIRDTSFLKEGFRFRFRNRASLPQNLDYTDKRGNVDHWNIDYVRLDRNRFRFDTLIRDVAFLKPIPSMLKNYESIPWDHFEQAYNELYLPYISLTYFNNDNIIRNVTRNIVITDPVHNETYQPGLPTAKDIPPDTSETARVTSLYPFEFQRGDTAVFEIQGAIRTDEFDYKPNDTLLRKQVFRDYFAYDDGTAERAYGLRGQSSINGMIAVRFESFIADNLGGVDIYFTQLKDSLNLNYIFRFLVWDDNEGLPGNLIYSGESYYSVFYADSLNQFTRIAFDQPVPVNGPFYVGIQQSDQYMLNIGLDINKPTNGNLLYNLGPGWEESTAPGMIMLRPYVKRYYSGIPADEIGHRENLYTLYPNPASDYLHVRKEDPLDNRSLTIELFDISGRMIRGYPFSGDPLYVGDLHNGLYIIRLRSESAVVSSHKILINH
jgi:hypothetical protein